jgi:hypothetical protein
MVTPKGASALRRVDKRKGFEQRAREWRVARLADLVRFAYRDRAQPAELLKEVNELFKVREFFYDGPLATANQAPRIQERLRLGLERVVSLANDGYETWLLPTFESEVSLKKLRTGDRLPDETEKDVAAKYQVQLKFQSFDDAFLYACAYIIGSPESWRLQKCSEPGCPKPFVQRKKSRYCLEHGSARARSERQRQVIETKLTPEQLRERRHGYYLNQLEKKRRRKKRLLRRQH